MSATVQIDVWSDYVCPFCYLELPEFERLKQRFGDGVQVRWRAFELRPAPTPTLDLQGEYLRTTWARAVYPLAARRGMRLRLPPVQPRSRLAFEAAAFARRHGRFDVMHRALFRAFFEDGRDIGEVEVLLELAADVGLETEALQAALRDGACATEVEQDQALAVELGIRAVPTLLLRTEGKSLQQAERLPGAVDYEDIARLIPALQSDA